MNMDVPFDTTKTAVILDSTRGRRHLDNTRSSPSSLEQVDASQTVLDWVLHALTICGIDLITYVGSYHIQKVIERYPNLRYRFQANWQHEGEISGLILARPPSDSDLLIVRAGTILVPEALRRLTEETEGPSAGYYGTGQGSSFVGLVSLRAAQVQQAFDIAESTNEREPGSNLEMWIKDLAAAGISLRSVDLDTVAAPVLDTVAVARTVFGGKGRTLEQVKPLIKKGIVLEQIRFKASEWEKDITTILSKIQSAFTDHHVVVRSSADAEDGLEESLAGRFASVLDVPASQEDDLREAIDHVLGSFKEGNRVAHSLDEILVQRHISDLAASGVLLTRDLSTGAPYYVLNIDRHSGKSDSVTSGVNANIDTVYVARNTDVEQLDTDVRACLYLGQELEELTHLDALDVEFGISKDGTMYLFQVRPIAKSYKTFELADNDLHEELIRIREFLDAHFLPHPTLAGNTTVLGTMPDWNPAEMIGTTPRPLALSLYQRLIGNEAWSASRAAIGYRDVRPEPLILALGGQPYVDTRASLNSFLPSSMDDVAAELWVNYCVDLLRENPRLHDKIEFDVTITCLAFDFEEHSHRLRRAGLNDTDIQDFRAKLLDITDAAITGRTTSVKSQFAQLYELDKRRQRWFDEEKYNSPALARRINSLLVDCERYGVTPFAVLARYAFISMTLLRSLVTVGVFSEDELERILHSIPTVASDLSRDLALNAEGRFSTAELLARYGHLRPSSYDITSPNYAAGFDEYIKHGGRNSSASDYPDISIAAEIFDSHAPEIDTLLRRFDFNATSEQFRDFILSSIPGREWAKSEFMKSVDAAIEGMAHFGCSLGFSRDDMSFLPVDLVVRGARESANSAATAELRRTIEFHKKRWSLTCAIHLPHLIGSTTDTSAFTVKDWTPNFISSTRVVAQSVVLETGLTKANLEGSIVLIRAADPGYDWIFSHSIAGLVTEFGGVASHMAIRAAEFGLPAAIGCGTRIFDLLCSAKLVELDCTNKKVRPLL